MPLVYGLLSALCLGVCLPMFFHEGAALHPGLSLMWKGLGTGCALLMALLGAIPNGQARWLCVAALALCTAADVLLDKSFLLGMGVFLLGHLCYIGWFAALTTPSAGHAAFVLPLLAIAAVVLLRWSSHMASKQLLPFLIYAAVLCLMAGFGAATGWHLRTPAAWIGAVGAVLFLISDMMVCREVLFPMNKTFEIITMVVYYVGQLLLSLSCALI